MRRYAAELGMVLIMIGMYLTGVLVGVEHRQSVRTIHAYVVVGSDVREEVQCEFDEPLKYLNLIMHAYDTNEEMYADYITLADPVEHEAIWGWSNCVWQPDDRWAACDIYYVKPDFVHADMNIDTIGHEVTHALCGDFHE